MDSHEPHPAPNEKMQPIQWTERPTGALVVVNSLWSMHYYVETARSSPPNGMTSDGSVSFHMVAKFDGVFYVLHCMHSVEHCWVVFTG